MVAVSFSPRLKSSMCVVFVTVMLIDVICLMASHHPHPLPFEKLDLMPFFSSYFVHFFPFNYNQKAKKTSQADGRRRLLGL